MFQLMRNTHLALGLLFVLMAAIFAVSSLTIIYRPWLPSGTEDSERIVTLDAEQGAVPREVALELMRNHDLRGDLRNIEQADGEIRFRVFRPGEEARVAYCEDSGQATIKTRRWNFLETLVQLHVNHGFHHDFMPSQGWALISLLTSIGMLLLGASGIYLWFAHHKERLVGGALLAVGLVWGLSTLTIARMM